MHAFDCRTPVVPLADPLAASAVTRTTTRERVTAPAASLWRLPLPAWTRSPTALLTSATRALASRAEARGGTAPRACARQGTAVLPPVLHVCILGDYACLDWSWLAAGEWVINAPRL